MDSFLVAFNAVIPFLCYISFGYIAKIKGFVEEEFLQKLNKMVFHLFYPFMMFYNIYKADVSSLPSPFLMVFTGGSILVVEALAILIVPRIIKENPKRGVIIQGVFRGNFVLFGLPLAISVFGDEAASMAAIIVTIVATIYNTTSVFILEMFNTAEKTSVKKNLLNVTKNPLLRGAVLGLIFFFAGIRIPKSLTTPVAAIANMTTPLALFVLGGTLHFDAVRGNLKYLVPTLSFKMVLIPAAVLAIGYAMGLRGIELFLLVGVHGTPIATASYPMAQNMGGDGELAGQFVVLSTVVCVVTLFLWVFILKMIGLI